MSHLFYAGRELRDVDTPVSLQYDMSEFERICSSLLLTSGIIIIIFCWKDPCGAALMLRIMSIIQIAVFVLYCIAKFGWLRTPEADSWFRGFFLALGESLGGLLFPLFCMWLGIKTMYAYASLYFPDFSSRRQHDPPVPPQQAPSFLIVPAPVQAEVALAGESVCDAQPPLCPICLLCTVDIAMIPCGHCFCQSCISIMEGTAAGRSTFTCGTCRSPSDRRQRIYFA
jgi:hypothetical protein